jgi:hypothetical protein
MQNTRSQSKQVGLFPCRGPVVPCRTLSLVSATCNGTVKPVRIVDSGAADERRVKFFLAFERTPANRGAAGAAPFQGGE